MFDEIICADDGACYQVGPRFVCTKHGDTEEVGVPERLENAEFWGTYEQEPDELWSWLRDFPSKECAVAFINELMEIRRIHGVSTQAAMRLRTELFGEVA